MKRVNPIIGGNKLEHAASQYPRGFPCSHTPKIVWEQVGTIQTRVSFALGCSRFCSHPFPHQKTHVGTAKALMHKGCRVFPHVPTGRRVNRND